MNNENTINPGDYISLEFTSENGEKYAIGYPNKAGHTKESLEAELNSFKKKQINDDISESVDSAFIPVNWPPPYPRTEMEGAVRKLGIDMVEIIVGGAIYKYRIHFYISKGWHYKFKDATGDIYHIETILNAWHYIDYNSKNPTIVGVSG